MTETETKQRGAQRIRLGERALSIAGEVAEGDQISQYHLEEAIRRLQDRPKPEVPTDLQDVSNAMQGRFDAIEDIIDDFEERHKEQLLMLNKALITLGHVIRASAAKRSEEIEISLGELRDRMFQHQIATAKTSELNVSELVDHNQRLAAFQRSDMETGMIKGPSETALER